MGVGACPWTRFDGDLCRESAPALRGTRRIIGDPQRPRGARFQVNSAAGELLDVFSANREAARTECERTSLGLASFRRRFVYLAVSLFSGIVAKADPRGGVLASLVAA